MAVLAWIKFLGFIGLEKGFMAPLYWVYFPLTLKEQGFGHGAFRLFTIQWIAFVAIWFVYDLFRRDLIGIVTIKKQLAAKRIIRADHETQEGDVSKRIAPWRYAALFTFLSWQVMPPLVVLCLRKNGQRRAPFVEIGMISTSTLIATLWWSLVSLGVIRVLSLWNN